MTSTRRAFTDHDVAVAIRHKHCIDTGFATEAVETYITQIEDVDGREIDRDAITEDDADFIIAAFASAQRAGDFGASELDDAVDATQAADGTAMNITTLDIRASYAIDGTHEWHEIDTNSDGFAGIVEDMLCFWNAADNRAGVFTISHTFRPDHFTTVVEIVGKVYGYRDGEVDKGIVDTVTVHVTAVER